MPPLTTYNIALDGGACVRYQFIAEYPHPVASLSTRCSTKVWLLVQGSISYWPAPPAGVLDGEKVNSQNHLSGIEETFQPLMLLELSVHYLWRVSILSLLLTLSPNTTPPPDVSWGGPGGLASPTRFFVKLPKFIKKCIKIATFVIQAPTKYCLDPHLLLFMCAFPKGRHT